MQARHSQSTWARLGAITRLRQLNDEKAAILRAFPDLKRPGALKVAAEISKTRRTISAEGRKAMSAGMRRYWARRKAAMKTGAKTASAKGQGS